VQVIDERAVDQRVDRFRNLAFVEVCSGTIHYWSVRSTGDHQRDIHLGRKYATDALRFVKEQNAPYIMPFIVRAMPKVHTGIETGFILGLTEQALS